MTQDQLTGRQLLTTTLLPSRSIQKNDLSTTPFMESVTDGYQDLIVSFTNELIIEHDCKTPTEIALARMAAAAYVKSCDYSEELRNCRGDTWLSGAKNGFFSMIGKEIDRANRQFMSAIIALKQLRSPSIEINVTAKNAFVAGKQQFNINQDATTHENIKPK